MNPEVTPNPPYLPSRLHRNWNSLCVCWVLGANPIAFYSYESFKGQIVDLVET